MTELTNDIIDPLDLKELQNIPLFSGLNEEQFHAFAPNVKEKCFHANELVFRQSDPASCFFYVREGGVILYRLSDDGNEKIIEIISEKQTFAEAVTFKGFSGYPVNAQTNAKTKLFAIDCQAYRDLLLKNPELSLQVLARLSKRLHFLITEVDKLTLHNASYRLIAFLLEKAEPFPKGGHIVQLNAPKYVIASRISVKPETFSRILKRLVAQRLIIVKSHQIHIIDKQALANYSLDGQ